MRRKQHHVTWKQYTGNITSLVHLLQKYSFHPRKSRLIQLILSEEKANLAWSYANSRDGELRAVARAKLEELGLLKK